MNQFKCYRHKDQVSQHVCLEKSCRSSSLLCNTCLTNHKTHIIFTIKEYLNSLQKTQVTDWDKNNFEKQYQQIEKSILKILSNFHESAKIFLDQLKQIQQREIVTFDIQLEKLQKQRNLLNHCNQALNSVQLQVYLNELITFNIDSEILQGQINLQKKKSINQQTLVNLQQEGSKMTNDFSEYIKKLLGFMGVDLLNFSFSIDSEQKRSILEVSDSKQYEITFRGYKNGEVQSIQSERSYTPGLNQTTHGSLQSEPNSIRPINNLDKNYFRGRITKYKSETDDDKSLIKNIKNDSQQQNFISPSKFQIFADLQTRNIQTRSKFKCQWKASNSHSRDKDKNSSFQFIKQL